MPIKSKSERDVARHLSWWKKCLGKLPLNRITSQIIAQCRRELSQEATPKGTLRSPSTTNRYMASISSVFTYGVKELGWLPENPSLRVSKLKEPAGRDRILTREECNRLLQACKQSSNQYLYAIVLLALTTGARKGEILSLTWNCISFEKGTIQLKKTKTNHPRSIALVGKTLETLRQLHIEKNPQQEKVFPGKKRFSQLDIRKAWIRACKEAELVDLRLHDLRHNFCTFAAQTGASNLELATAMGHRTLQMLKRYCHLDSKLTKRLSEHVDQLIEEE